MQSHASSRTVTVQIVTVAFEGLASIACPDCQAVLDLAQPDPYSADRFLGTCGECSGWFLVTLSSEAGEARVVSLAPVAKLAGGVQIRPRRTGG